MAKHTFTIDAIVILPEHIHALWTLPDGDADYSTRWMLIKTKLTRSLHRSGVSGPIWQARYWEHLIRDEADFAAHADYIHYNPVKHEYVKAPIDWPWSSFRRWVELGRYPIDWGAAVKIPVSIGRE